MGGEAWIAMPTAAATSTMTNPAGKHDLHFLERGVLPNGTSAKTGDAASNSALTAGSSA